VTSPSSVALVQRGLLTDSLLIQCGSDVADVIPTLSAGVGVVASGASAISGVRHAMDAGCAGPLRADRRRYMPNVMPALPSRPPTLATSRRATSVA
jgi:hypothetical protein